MEIRVRSAGQVATITVHREGGGLTVRRDDGEAVAVQIVDHDESSLLLEIDGRRHRVRWARRGDDLHLALAGHGARFHRVDEEEEEELEATAGSPVVRAPMPGRVLEVLVEPGQEVVVGQPVVRVEAMKMEVALEAAVDGTVDEVRAEAEQLVEPEQILVTITPRDGD